MKNKYLLFLTVINCMLQLDAMNNNNNNDNEEEIEYLDLNGTKIETRELSPYARQEIETVIRWKDNPLPKCIMNIFCCNKEISSEVANRFFGEENFYKIEVLLGCVFHHVNIYEKMTDRLKSIFNKNFENNKQALQVLSNTINQIRGNDTCSLHKLKMLQESNLNPRIQLKMLHNIEEYKILQEYLQKIQYLARELNISL